MLLLDADTLEPDQTSIKALGNQLDSLLNNGISITLLTISKVNGSREIREVGTVRTIEMHHIMIRIGITNILAVGETLLGHRLEERLHIIDQLNLSVLESTRRQETIEAFVTMTMTGPAITTRIVLPLVKVYLREFGHEVIRLHPAI